MTHSIHKHKKGFALTEVLLSIAVIIVVGVSAFALYKSSSEGAKVEKTANMFAQIENNINVLYGGSYGRGNLTLDTLAQNKLLPDAGFTTTSTTWGEDTFTVYLNLWGGEISLNTYGAGWAQGPYTITMTGVPQESCTKLVNRLSPSYSVVGADASGYSIDVKDQRTDDKVDVAALAKSCATDQNTISFVAL